MKIVISSLVVAAVMTFGFTTLVSAQPEDSLAATADTTEEVAPAADETIADQAQEGDVEETPAEEAGTDFVQQLKQKYIEGDPLWMTPVLICLIIGLSMSIERIVYLNLSTINTQKFLDEVETALKNGGVEAAKDVCRNTRGPIASIFYQGLDRADEGIEMVEKSVVSYGGVQMGLLEKGLSWLSLFIALAPMLGFLGTVIGMIFAFDQIVSEGQVSPTKVAGGIKVSLLTTVFGLIEPSDTIKLLAEIGIILLLFEVGLETDLERLVRAGPRAATVALFGFVIPFLLGFGLSFYIFNLSILVSLFIGGTLTATSIGVTVRILADLGRHRSSEGQIVLGAAVVDDILGVFLLAVLYEFSVSGTVSLYNAGKIIFFVTLFFVIAPVAAKLLSGLIKRYHVVSEIPGIIPTTMVSLVLLFAALAHLMGAPELLGGFAAGIALSRRFFLPFGAALHTDPDFTAKMHQEIRPIIQLFTPIFFVMVGLSLDLSAIDWSSGFIWAFSISMAVIAIIGKLAGPFFVREPNHRRIAIGMAMVPRGEVGLIFAELGRVSGIFNNAVYAGMIIVIAYTTLFSPFWIKAYYRRFNHLFSRED